MKKQSSVATFAAGCFWCIEATFEHLSGVSDVIAGYTGGTTKNPTYEEVCEGTTGHVEAVEVHFDPQQISYAELLDVFWRNIDPTDEEGQFIDKGPSYTTAIFYHNDEQKALAEQSKQKLSASGMYTKPIVTRIRPATTFYPAEEYHQDFYKKEPARYQAYRKGSGRPDNQAPSENRLSQLSPLQREVTQACSTEPPFQNEYWNNHEEGLYVDIVSGEPLFSSRDKFDSGTGWPSFTKPVTNSAVIEKQDTSHNMKRVEIKSATAQSHLGHVFPDGPEKTGGLRYCINSASLRFIPVKDLEKEGYGAYKQLFSTLPQHHT